MGLNNKVEKVQNMQLGLLLEKYYFEEGSLTGILAKLKWEILKKRRKDNRLILVLKV